MTNQIRGALLALTLTAALAACAATSPASPIANGSAGSSAPAANAAAKHVQGAYGNYTRVVRNGQTLYCNKDKDTGTRMVHETCLTQSEVEAQQDNARNFMQGVQGMAASPPSNPNSAH